MRPSVSVRLLLTQSDARLVALACDGHERAFEALVQRYKRPLLGHCRRLLLPHERAEDTLQQAWLQAWLALQGGVEVSDPRSWLYRIVHNTALNALRVSGYDYCTLSESLSGAEAPQADLDRRIAVREALAGLAALPPMQREALLRTAIEGASHAQAAEDLGVTETALRGLVYRARTTLRTAVTAITPPPLVAFAVGAGTRSTPFAESVAGAGASGGSAGLAGFLLKGGAVVMTAGTFATGIGIVHRHHGSAKTHSGSRGPRPGTPTAMASDAATSSSEGPAMTARRIEPASHIPKGSAPGGPSRSGAGLKARDISRSGGASPTPALTDAESRRAPSTLRHNHAEDRPSSAETGPAPGDSTASSPSLPEQPDNPVDWTQPPDEVSTNGSGSDPSTSSSSNHDGNGGSSEESSGTAGSGSYSGTEAAPYRASDGGTGKSSVQSGSQDSETEPHGP